MRRDRSFLCALTAAVPLEAVRDAAGSRGASRSRRGLNKKSQIQIEWVPLNRLIATSDQKQVFAAKRRKIRRVLLFPLLRFLRDSTELVEVFFVADVLALGLH